MLRNATFRCPLLSQRTDAERGPAVERSRQAILAATLQVLAPDGDVGSLNVETVAARSGAAKTTIYRRWRDKSELALDAVIAHSLRGSTIPSTSATPAGSCSPSSTPWSRCSPRRPTARQCKGWSPQIATDPELARIYPEQVVQPRLAQPAPVITRGIARGDLRADTDVRPRKICE